VINSNLGPIAFFLATIHPLETRRIDGRQSCHKRAILHSCGAT